jgi:protein O-mannosyl-transferase
VDDSVDNAAAPANGGLGDQPPSKLAGLAPWLALVLIALAFVRCLGFGFVNWDDGLHVMGNPAVTGTGDARAGWLTPSLGYAIPVTVASYRLEYQLVGGAPWLYHATNLLLHLGVCGLVFLLGRRAGLGRVGASIGMLFFGLHPVVAEPVCWVSGRKDLLATYFGLAATWWLLRDQRAKPSVATVVVSSLLFALAALSKPSVLALPLFWAVSSSAMWKARRGWLPAAAIAGCVAALGWLGQQQLGALGDGGSWLSWARQIGYALGYHLGLALFVQQPLAKHIPERMPPPFEAMVDLLPVAVALLGWWWLRRRQYRWPPVVRLGLLFACLAYLPSAGFVPLVRYLADCYVYLPLVGVAWIVGGAAESIAPRLRRTWAAVLTLAAAAAFFFGASTAAMAWHDSVALWKTVYQRYPDSPQVCLNYGNAFFEQGKTQTALALYDHCTRQFGPDHFAKNRAITLFVLGRHADAEPIFRELATKFPDDAVVRKYLGYLAQERRAPEP